MDINGARKQLKDKYILIIPFLMENVKHFFNFNVHTVANNTYSK